MAAGADPPIAGGERRYYGKRRFGSPIGSPLPEAVEFNIWELPDTEVFAKIVSDPEYQANIAERDRIHDMGKLTMILAAPVK